MDTNRYRPDGHLENGMRREDVPLNNLNQISSADRRGRLSRSSISPVMSRSSSEPAKDQQVQLENDVLQSRKASSPSPISQAEDVRHHGMALLLFLVYAAIAILSWIFTCLLCNHPIGVSTWYDQYGNYSMSHYQHSDRLRRASSVGLSVITAIGIPVTSAIAARAAASYCQINSFGQRRSLTMRQMLALADKGWSGYGCIRELLEPHTSRAIRTPLLISVMPLVLTGMFTP